VFLDDMWGVLDDCYSKLASSLLANLLIEINADKHRKIGGSKENWWFTISVYSRASVVYTSTKAASSTKLM